MGEQLKMGRPYVYDPNKPRRPRLISLSDELWDALGDIAGEKKRTQYIEEKLRSLPEVAKFLKER